MKLKLNLDPKIALLSMDSKKDRYIELMGRKIIQVRRGIEFDHFREYTQSDDSRLIDWKASLRAQKKLVRVFQEDRATSAAFLVDVGKSMVFGTVDKLKIEYAFELLSSLSFGMLNNDDKVSITLFNENIVEDIAVKSGLSSYVVIQDMLKKFDKFGGIPDLLTPIMMCEERQQKINVVVIISDFIMINEHDLINYLNAIPKTVDVIGIMINDPTDISIPADTGLVSLKDPMTGDIRLVNSGKATVEYTKKNKERINKVKESFEKVEGDFVLFTTDMKFEEKIVKFFEYRHLKGGGRI